MDISSLKNPCDDIDWAQLQEWAKRAHHRLTRTTGVRAAGWEEAFESERGSSSVPAKTLVDWFRQHDFLSSKPQSGLSMKGVGFVLASPSPRWSPAASWEEAARLLARVEWLNGADGQLASLRVADVLVFGSMTAPGAKDHGDLDALVVFEPTHTGADRERAFAAAGWTFDQRPSGLPFFRGLAQSQLAGASGFCSLTSEAQDVSVLLDQDTGFACYSLLGRQWDAAALAHTTADEHAFVVLQALENGHQDLDRKAHVERQLSEAKERLGLSSPKATASLALSSVNNDDRAKAIWWASLQPLGPSLLLAQEPAESQRDLATMARQQLQNVSPVLLSHWSVGPTPSHGFKGPR